MNAGFTPFPISPRNSADSVAHLLASTACQIVVVSSDKHTRRLADASFALYRQQNTGSISISIVDAPLFENLYPTNTGQVEELATLPFRKVTDQSTPCVIIHSSGTVSYPKHVIITYRMFFEHALIIGEYTSGIGLIQSSFKRDDRS